MTKDDAECQTVIPFLIVGAWILGYVLLLVAVGQVGLWYFGFLRSVMLIDVVGPVVVGVLLIMGATEAAREPSGGMQHAR